MPETCVNFSILKLPGEMIYFLSVSFMNKNNVYAPPRYDPSQLTGRKTCQSLWLTSVSLKVVLKGVKRQLVAPQWGTAD